MQTGRILFVGGNVERLASVKIRCREIARRLGCDTVYGARGADEVPTGYDAYFCVKPDFRGDEVARLAKRAPVIWDILDDQPPQEGVTAYVCSTEVAHRIFKHLGRIAVIPHYHCNIERAPHQPSHHEVAYLGSAHWYPQINHIPHKTYFIEGWTREKVVQAYRSIGISLNLRTKVFRSDKFPVSSTSATPVPELHVQLNSGIKLINCLGFGIPSVSQPEPAYREIAPDCTVFTELESYHEAVETLQSDSALFQALRRRCLERAEDFHVDRIEQKYRDLIRSL